MRPSPSLASDLRSSNVVLVDDDGELVVSLARALKGAGFEGKIHAVSRAEAALDALERLRPEVMIVDLCLNEAVGTESGLTLIREILSRDPTVRVIVLTGHGGAESGVLCLKLGAANFLEKPADVQHILALIRDGATQSSLRRRVVSESSSEMSIRGAVIGSSSPTRELVQAIKYAASNNQSVLITGETGTGKGLCAQAIHSASSRSARSFVRYQPTFSTPDLVNSDLFGHVKGAFTGANETRKGLIAEADGGTLFLDEVDELPVETQVALLGVLQERRFRPLGSNREERADFRLVCATNRDIDLALREGKIRKDFYHRIAHSVMYIAPLRERGDDILDLANHVVSLLREREQVSVFGISTAAADLLISYRWPGNVRELEAVVEGAAYAAQFAGRTSIEPVDLSLGRSSSPVHSDGSFHVQVERFKKKLIEEALQKCGGNQVKAAAELKLDRSSMRRILARHEDG